MPIQFFCEGCRQPIEIDDDGAGEPVTCPFCHHQMTAPTAPDPAVADAVQAGPPPTAPMAEPVTMRPDAGGPPPIPIQPTNHAAWVAFVLALVFIISAIITSVQLAPIMQQAGEAPTMQEQQTAIHEELSQRPLLMTFSMAGVCIAPVVALLLAFIGMTNRRQPRWPAVTALAILGAMLLLNCSCFLLSAAMQGMPPA